MLSLRDIHAGYDRGGNVLQGVDLEIEPGSAVCIIGPNGAGKSTVLRVASGLLHPRRGEIRLDGERIDRLGAPEVLARGVAHVPQADALFPKMTIRENVLLGGYLIRRSRRLLKQRYDAVAGVVPLVRDRPGVLAGNLSGGQRRMIEIARTMMLEPAVVLLDEPSLGLDPHGLEAVGGLVRRLADRGTTVVLVEQNVRFGLKLSSHAVVMECGRVRLRGTAAEVLEHPELGARYLEVT